MRLLKIEVINRLLDRGYIQKLILPLLFEVENQLKRTRKSTEP